MTLREPFIINHIRYTQSELIEFAFKVLETGKLKEWEFDFYQFILAFLDPEVTLQQQTSGTTGDPKTIELKRDAMIHSAKMTIDYFDLQAGDNALLCLPVQYIAGKMMLVRAFVGGLNLITTEPTGHPLKNIDTEIKFAAMVPLQVIQTIENPEQFDSVRKLVIGGGEIKSHLLEKIKKLQITEVFESFAMSETCSHFALRRLNGKKPETAFCKLRGVNIGIDERSCLNVSIKGITEGIIQSNDLVELSGKNKFKWLGRIDNVINSGGKKIIPEQLESKIRSIIDPELLILGLPDKKLGQRLVLVVEADPKSSPVSTWKESLTQILTRHEVPREIICISKLPRTGSMKVDRLGVMELIKKSLIQS